jgi:hypothetical protein
VIIPIGITKETVEKSLANVDNIHCIIAVTVPGLMEEKDKILQGLSFTAKLLGASYYKIVVSKEDLSSIAMLARILVEENPKRVILVGTTGSRFLYPILY